MSILASNPIRLAVVALLALLALAATVAVAAPREHLRVRVLVLDFDPLMDNELPLTVDRGWNDPLALDHEYRGDVAVASGGIVDQRIVQTVVVRGFPVKPGGFTLTNEQYLGCLADSSPTYCKALIDYPAVLNTAYSQQLGSACQAVARKRVDEVWLWGGPWFGYLEYLVVEAGTVCPGVDRPFVVMGFSYERAVAEMLHDLGHRSEALVQTGVGLGLWDRFDGQRARYAEDFACPPAPDATHPEVDSASAHAGNVHFPPNAYCHYQYDRDHPVMSDADDWTNFPNLTGRRTVVNASTWGGTQQGFMIWWLGNFPRSGGCTGGVENDWWRYVFPARKRGLASPAQSTEDDRPCPVGTTGRDRDASRRVERERREALRSRGRAVSVWRRPRAASLPVSSSSSATASWAGWAREEWARCTAPTT